MRNLSWLNLSLINKIKNDFETHTPSWFDTSVVVTLESPYAVSCEITANQTLHTTVGLNQVFLFSDRVFIK